MRWEHQPGNPGDAARTWIERPGFDPAFQLGENLLIVGTRGTGKSHALAAISDCARDADVLPLKIGAGSVSSYASFYAPSEMDEGLRTRRIYIEVVAIIANALANGLADRERISGESHHRAESALADLIEGLLLPEVRHVNLVNDETSTRTSSSGKARALQASIGSIRLELDRKHNDELTQTFASRVNADFSDHLSLDLLHSVIEDYVRYGPFEGVCLELDEAECLSAPLQLALIDQLLRSLPSHMLTLVVAARRGGLWLSSPRLDSREDPLGASSLDVASAFSSLIDLDFAHAALLGDGKGGNFVRRLAESDAPGGLTQSFISPADACSLLATATHCNPRRIKRAFSQCLDHGANGTLGRHDIIEILKQEHHRFTSVAFHNVATELFLHRLQSWALATGTRQLAVERDSIAGEELSFLSDAGVLQPVPSEIPGMLAFNVSPSTWYVADLEPPSLMSSSPVIITGRILGEIQAVGERLGVNELFDD